jgi:hypothetical protein
MLPLKTTIEDLDKLVSYLRTQIGMVDLTKVRGALDSKTTDNRKLEAATYIGLISREGQKIEITTEGRRYASTSDPAERAAVMAELIARKPLYAATVEWMHYTAGAEPVKTAIGDYWYKNHEALLEGSRGAALTDAVVFFMRFADAAGLGKFVSAGKGRPETYFKGDAEAIERIVLGGPIPGTSPMSDQANTEPMRAITAVSSAPTPVTAPTTAVPIVSAKPSRTVNVNIEIHIPADATPEKIAQILRSVRENILEMEEN